MPNLFGKVLLTIIYAVMVIALVGCSSGAVVEDIGPVASVEAPATPVPETAEELPAQDGQPAEQDQANVPTEIIEPVSPVIPTTATQTEPKIDMGQATRSQSDLPAEIIEPVSPVTPAEPAEEKATSMDQQSQEPLKGSENLVAAVIADLTRRRGIPANEIALVSVEAVDWSDTSLGCPEEGFMYAQVITPGYSIILEAGGQAYNYHTDQAENFVLCEQ